MWRIYFLKEVKEKSIDQINQITIKRTSFFLCLLFTEKLLKNIYFLSLKKGRNLLYFVTSNMWGEKPSASFWWYVCQLWSWSLMKFMQLLLPYNTILPLNFDDDFLQRMTTLSSPPPAPLPWTSFSRDSQSSAWGSPTFQEFLPLFWFDFGSFPSSNPIFV